MLTDPISDMLTRIKNAYMARKAEVVLPSSKIKMAIAKILKENNYIAEFSESGDVKKEMKLKLSYKNRQPAMQEAKRISKPGRRIYSGADELPKVLSGYGISILSTSRGIMTNREARKQKIGGEVICEIY
jgi:small subunit ribosomal protein S8